MVFKSDSIAIEFVGWRDRACLFMAVEGRQCNKAAGKSNGPAAAPRGRIAIRFAIALSAITSRFL